MSQEHKCITKRRQELSKFAVGKSSTYLTIVSKQKKDAQQMKDMVKQRMMDKLKMQEDKYQQLFRQAMFKDDLEPKLAVLLERLDNELEKEMTEE